jgi:hypothetical protein
MQFSLISPPQWVTKAGVIHHVVMWLDCNSTKPAKGYDNQMDQKCM